MTDSIKALLRRLGIALGVSLLLVALVTFGPVALQQAALTALIAIIAAVGTAVANHVKDDRTITQQAVEIQSLKENHEQH